jgi:hypothetical protein
MKYVVYVRYGFVLNRIGNVLDGVVETGILDRDP